ncbi:ATP-binding cassette domain-containing protein [Edwardsiella tarda]
MLSCHDLAIRQGGKWLWQGLNLTLQPGERLGISAPSGFGKTTLGRVLAGWQKAAAGQVRLDGAPLPSRGYCPVQLVPQHPELTFNPWRTTGAALHDAWRPDAQILARLHIQPQWLLRKPGQLSGGELARIALLRALDPRTRYLIADEITAQLDPAIQRDIWHYLLQESQRRPLGMIIFSHQQALLQQIAPRILTPADSTVAPPSASASDAIEPSLQSASRA